MVQQTEDIITQPNISATPLRSGPSFVSTCAFSFCCPSISTVMYRACIALLAFMRSSRELEIRPCSLILTPLKPSRRSKTSALCCRVVVERSSEDSVLATLSVEIPGKLRITDLGVPVLGPYRIQMEAMSCARSRCMSTK